jgi:hypothetical protein
MDGVRTENPGRTEYVAPIDMSVVFPAQAGFTADTAKSYTGSAYLFRSTYAGARGHPSSSYEAV